MHSILIAQVTDSIVGVVSFQNSQNIYLKFKNTDKLKIGDSLYRRVNDDEFACLIIQQLSSQSAVCQPTLLCKVSVGDIFYFIPKAINDKNQFLSAKTDKENVTKRNIDTLFNPSAPLVKNDKSVTRENLNLRFLSSATGSFNNTLNDGTHRARGSLTFNFENINNSKWSIHSFINYNYRFGKVFNPNVLKSDLKIYGVDVEYKIDSTQLIMAGRRINHNISSVGAIDGIQYEKKIKRFLLGVAAGSRPDLTSYRFNIQLPLYGVYAGFNSLSNLYQNTIGIFEIRSHGRTDRRFTYVQHSNSGLIKNLFLFSSAEFDLYQIKDSVISNSPRLTSFFLNARYKINRKLSFSASYDNRKNVIFYESFKNQLDQLLDEETRTGIRLQASYQLLRYLNTNVSYFYRYQGNQKNPTKNFSSYIGSNRIPGIKTNLSISYNYIETIYFIGQTLSFRANKDFFKSRTNIELEYRNINYNYLSSEFNLPKNIFSISISQILTRYSTLLLSLELDNEPQQQAQRYFVTFIRRFKQK